MLQATSPGLRPKDKEYTCSLSALCNRVSRVGNLPPMSTKNERSSVPRAQRIVDQINAVAGELLWTRDERLASHWKEAHFVIVQTTCRQFELRLVKCSVQFNSQWLFFQNVIQVQPHGGKNPIVLYQEMWLQVFRHVSLHCSHHATVQLVRSPARNS